MAKLSRENLIALALAKLKEKGLEPLEGKGLTVHNDNIGKKANWNSLYYIGNQSGYRVASCVFIGATSKFPKLLIHWADGNKNETIGLDVQPNVTNEELEEFNKEEEHQRHIIIERMRQKHDEAAKEANEELAKKDNATSDNAYLKRKGLPAVFGLKVGKYWDNTKKITVQDCLFVPKKNALGFIRSYEVIEPDGTKISRHDAEHDALYFEITAAENCVDKRTFITEGAGNAITAYIASGARVISCGDAHNIAPVVTALHREGKLDPANTYIIYDNDWKEEAQGKGNVGRECAIKAAVAIGCKVIEGCPTGLEMEGNPKGATDINDLMQIQGIEAVRALLLPENAEYPDTEDEEEAPVSAVPYPPKGIFPKPLEDAVQDVANVFSRGNPTFATVGLLTVFAHGVNGYAAIQIMDDKPIHGNGYIFLIGNSSSSKSDCIKTFLRPFRDADTKTYLSWKKHHDEYVKAIKKWNLRSKEQIRQDEENEVQKPEDIPVPISDMQGQDITSEGLFDVMYEIMWHDGTSCASIIGDEASEMLQNLDAYKPNGNKSTNKVIEMWDCGTIKKTRSMAGTGYRQIPKACLTITGCTQPVELCNMFTERDLKRGLAGRFILIQGRQTTPPKWPDRTKISKESKDTIDKLCAFMFNLRNPTISIDMAVGNCVDLNQVENPITTKIFTLSKDAYEYWVNWYNKTGPQYWIQGEDRESLFQKLSMNTSKIALYIHVAKLAFKEEYEEERLHPSIVTLDTIEKATKFGDYIGKSSKPLWNMILGKKTAKEIPAPALKLAEIIVHHANDIDEKTRFVTNATLKDWCQKEGLPIENKNQIANLSQALELSKPSGVSTSKRGRVITLDDIDRLAAIVEASKIGQE